MMTSRKLLSVLVASSVLIMGGCGSRGADNGDTGAEANAGNGVVYNPDGTVAGGDPSLGAAVGPDVIFEVFSDQTDIQTGSEESAVISATLIDADRNPMENIEVTWAATGGVLQDRTLISDSNGLVMATLRVPQDFINRDIDVTISAGEHQATVTVSTYGTRLDVQGTEKSVVFGGELDVDLTLTAGDGEPIINTPITLTSAQGNTFTPEVPVTDQNGKVSVSIGSDLGADVISYGALDDPTLSGSFRMDVSADELTFLTVGDATEFAVNTNNTVTVEWLSGGLPVVNGPLRVSTTAGAIQSDSILYTDSNGLVTIPISSPSAGDARLSVQDATDGAPFSTFDMKFIATTPSQLEMSSTSTRVFVDEDRAELTALVRDVNGNAVRGQEVTFSASDLRGGQLSPSTAITNDQGEATTTFIAGTTATEIDAIQVFGTVQGTNITGSVNLSVVERRLNVTIGAGSRLSEDELLTQNFKNMVVQVADGSGAPIADATVSLSITPISYNKGFMTRVDSAGVPQSAADSNWSPDSWTRFGAPYTITCDAEDLNLNRTLDPGEDVNGNGSLDPQDPALLAPVEGDEFATLSGNGTLTTDANGTGYFRMIYPKSNANWSFLRITARAVALGTEAQDDLQTRLPSLIGDVDDAQELPPNYTSPYGTQLSCQSPD